MSWLKNALSHSNKPQHSIIGELKKTLGGYDPGRSRDVVHASDVTKPSFCPREWALMDIGENKPKGHFINTALDVTFRIGKETERLFVEEWMKDTVYGNWQCRYCGEQRSMCYVPTGFCKETARRHWWEYLQVRVDSSDYGVSGGIDALVNLGAPRLFVAEIKILAAEEFDKMVAPQAEHRLRTNLYMKLIAGWNNPYKNLINVDEARVLYISRGFGRKDPAWNEILPFREFVVKRDDKDLAEMLQRAVALKTFRDQKKMPQGICATANDPIAKQCSKVKECFSGEYPAQISIKAMMV